MQIKLLPSEIRNCVLLQLLNVSSNDLADWWVKHTIAEISLFKCKRCRWLNMLSKLKLLRAETQTERKKERKKNIITLVWLFMWKLSSISFCVISGYFIQILSVMTAPIDTRNLAISRWSPTTKEGNVLFNDALNTFYLRLYGVGHMVKDHSDTREETCCHHMGYSFRLAARVLLYASSHTQDNTYHGLCYTSRGALAGTRNKT